MSQTYDPNTRKSELRGLSPNELEKVYRQVTGRDDGGRITQMAKIDLIVFIETPKVRAADGGLGEEEVVEVP